MQLISTLAHEIMCEPYQSYHSIQAAFDYLGKPYSLYPYELLHDPETMPWGEWIASGGLKEYMNLPPFKK